MSGALSGEELAAMAGDFRLQEAGGSPPPAPSPERVPLARA